MYATCCKGPGDLFLTALNPGSLGAWVQSFFLCGPCPKKEMIKLQNYIEFLVSIVSFGYAFRNACTRQLK